MLDTPNGNRVHIAFFGLRNAGKSTLVNAFCGQPLAIVSPTPGTTTDPVSKAMEILPLGPCLVTDTAGLDDEGDLGRMRVEKTMKVLESTDVAIWVRSSEADEKTESDFRRRCEERRIPFLVFNRGDSVEELKNRVAGIRVTPDPGLLDGLVGSGDRVVLVCPIDGSAPKGRLILPQVQVLRECLDLHAVVTVCQPEELGPVLAGFREADPDRSATGDGRQPTRRVLVITDSQAFAAVSATISAFGSRASFALTSFSVLFARQKGDLGEFRRGLERIRLLKEGDRVLIAEACTHHRQCNDIGTTRMPKALEKLSGVKLEFSFSSGNDFQVSDDTALVVHCGGCMLSRRQMLSRISAAKALNVPIVNYGLVLAAANGLSPEDLVVC